MKLLGRKTIGKGKGGAPKAAAKGAPKGEGKPRKASAPPAGPVVRATAGLSLDAWIDILGVALLLASGLTIFAALSPNRTEMSQGWLALLSRTFGWGVYVAPFITGLIALYLLVRRFGDRFPLPRPNRILGTLLAFFCALPTLHIFGQLVGEPDGTKLAEIGKGGGTVGWGLLQALQGIFGDVGAPLALIVLWLGAFMLLSELTFERIYLRMRDWLGYRMKDAQDAIIERRRDRVPGSASIDRGDGMVIRGLGFGKRKAADRPAHDDQADDEDLRIELPPVRKVTAKAAAQPAAPSANDVAAPSFKINSPKSSPQARAGELNRVPPPRIIGGETPAQQANNAAAAAVAQASPVQPSAPPATQVTSRIQVKRNWQLPPIATLLDPGSEASMKEADIRARAAIIEDTLRAFGVPGRVTEVNRGPTITQFGVEPGFIEMKGGKSVKVKVSRIASLADDLALALAASRIRIEAPVPGRAIVGIEVPNGEKSLVSLRDVMESDEFEKLAQKTRLRLALGQDVSGHSVVADLASMPHLLIAGTTGSGKSVCVNGIIITLLCNNSPEDVRFLMVDPKRVELTGYNGIPHLIAPVIVETEKTPAVLQWTMREMDTRYRMFAKHGVRNILDFNAKCAAVASTAGHDPELQKLPYIVLIIDELADLMMMSPDETEKSIIRLAQMARATGIHLIIATQRPSVDVVTGLIKANFPARVAFTVATAIDSRVILDSPGAEKLLGRGDMLVVTPESSLPMRAQGCWLSPDEMTRVVRHWRAQLGAPEDGADPITAATTAPLIPQRGSLDVVEQESVVIPAAAADPFSPPPTWDEARALNEAAGEVGSGGSKDDKLFIDAVNTVRMHGKASISLLQRRLRIGYTRAARLIEEMEERGIVGPTVQGQQHREVLNAPINPNGS